MQLREWLLTKHLSKGKKMTTKAQMFFRKNPTGKNIFSVTTLNYSGSSYGRHNAGKDYIYGYDCNGEEFHYFVTHHRAKQIIRMLQNNTWWELDSGIRSNYSTNGHTTRCGVRRANKKRCAQLQESHVICSASGKAAHDYRVAIRN